MIATKKEVITIGTIRFAEVIHFYLNFNAARDAAFIACDIQNNYIVDFLGRDGTLESHLDDCMYNRRTYED